jgi:esterase/lipase
MLIISNKFIITISIFSISYVILSIIHYMFLKKNTRKTFDRLNKIFSGNQICEDLKIYNASVPMYNFNHDKKDRVLLLIGGYRDIPNMWYNYVKYLDENKIDYYAPRTMGNGRTFFQKKVKWYDWVLTYFEAMIILSKIYKKIELVGFSTGCNISVYLASLDWKTIERYDSSCIINNMILLSPNFQVNDKHVVYKNLLQNSFIYHMLNFILPVADKPSYDKNREIDLKYTKNITKIYYERSIYLESLRELWRFSDILPENIYAKEVFIFYGDSDKVVGDFRIQRKKIESIYSKKIKSYKLTNCGHNLINEHPNIRLTLFNKIDIIIKN